MGRGALVVVLSLMVGQSAAWAATEVAVRDLSGVRLHLARTDGAAAIMKAGKWDVADASFDEAGFESFILDTYANALEYFTRLVPEKIVTEATVTIDDLGDARRDTISQARVGTHEITVDVRRWHKLYKGYRAYLADLTSIHEFTHVTNYFVDAGETRKHRELVAVVFESLNLIHRHGVEMYSRSYLARASVPVSKPEDVLGDDYHGMPALRALAHSVLTKVLDGRYPVKEDRLAALERFAHAYLVDRQHGAAGFDAAAAQAGLTDRDGQPLTLSRAQSDLFEELRPAPAKGSDQPRP